MTHFTKFFVFLFLALFAQLITAQDVTKEQQLEQLKALKEEIKMEERTFLKEEVEAINKRLDAGEITLEEAKKLKSEAAKKRALNIENRIAIVNNQIALLERNEEKSYVGNIIAKVLADEELEEDDFINLKRRDKRKYDRRTNDGIIIGIGFNNAIIEGESINDSPYKFGGSRYFELGYEWRTRLFKNSNTVRFHYGVSLHFNGLKPTDNRYFVENGDETTLEEFPFDLKKSKLNITNLVMPVHFEFGPSRKIEREDYYRYSIHKKFRFGIGAYGGFNIGTKQKLKYTENGDRVKDKMKNDYNVSTLVYGLSTYAAAGNVAIYAKYDLSPLFRDQLVDQHNISLGIRFDL